MGQHLASDSHLLQTTKVFPGDSVSSIFENFPRKCRSNNSMSKEPAKVLDSAKETTGLIEQNHPKSHSITCPRKPRKKRCKTIAKSSDSGGDGDGDDDVFVRRLRVRGQAKRSSNSSPQKKLNSKRFEDYMAHIWSTYTGENRNSFLCLDSLWFALYSQKPSKEKVLNWIKKKGIFSKKYVLVPIVMWSHWSLLILCNVDESPESTSKGPCMLLLDSLQTTNPKRLEPGIRKFVSDIYCMHQRPGNMVRKIPFLVPKVPQQRDGEECGNFVLYYISLFLKNAPEDFSSSEGYPYFMKEDWFTLEEFDLFCKKLEVECSKNNSLSADE